jgi:hypothetical protein
MKTFKAMDKVVVKVPQLHGNISVLEQGEVISVSSQAAVVQLEGEDVPRTIPLDRLQSAQELYGDMTDRPNEMPTIDQIRY